MDDLLLCLDGGQAREVERHRLCAGPAQRLAIGAGQMSRVDSCR